MTSTTAAAPDQEGGASWLPMIGLCLAQVLRSFNVAALPVSIGGIVDELDVTGPNAAFLVDSFSEVVPASQATTGLTFHYDVPDATPPQNLLLVVPPDPDAGWRWEDLLVALHDTLELAKDRAVEPEHLQGTLYAQLLPALLGEVPAGEDATGAGGHRVVLDFAHARATEA